LSKFDINQGHYTKAWHITTQDMTQMQTQEADGSVLRIFIITKGHPKGQAEVHSPRQSQKGTEQQAGRLEPGRLENKHY
jgi:hypothetical protein